MTYLENTLIRASLRGRLAFLFAAALTAASLAAQTPTTAELSPERLFVGEAERASPVIQQHSVSVDQLQNSPPPKAAKLFREGWDAFQAGKLGKSERKLKKALRVHPNFVAAHNNLAYHYCLKNRLDDAARHFKAAIAIDPNNAAARVNLAIVLYSKGKHDQGLKAIRQAMKDGRGSSRAHYVAGLLLLESSMQGDEALAHLMEAGREYPTAQVIAAYAMLRLDKPESARETLRRYLRRAREE